MRPRLALLAGLLVLVACRSSTAPPPRFDGGTGDGGMDSGPPPDGGTDAAADGGTDAGMDAGPTCGCPVLPETCALPPSDSPVFAPAPDDGPYPSQLLGLIACAETSLEAAIYETTSDCVVDALLAALDRTPALTLSLVIDDDQCPRDMGGTLACPVARLEAHDRVTVVDDSRSALMHHKFIVVDGERVWVSSGNFTEESFCQDFNNSLIVEQPEIVAGYEAQFTRHFTDGMFGPVPPADPITGGIYSLYFSPETPVDSPSRWFTDMIAAIDAATGSIDFMIFSLTRTEVSDALIRADMRGVTVRGVVSSRFRSEMAVQALIDAGIEVRVDSVHSKVMVVDDMVVTGSANWSAASWNNDEDDLFIRDATIAGVYRTEVGRVFDGASPP